MPFAFIFEEPVLPHSPKGFLSISFDRVNHRFAISSFLYLSETSFRCSKNLATISDSSNISSSERVEYNVRRDVWIFFDRSLSILQRCLNSKSSLPYSFDLRMLITE